MNYFKCISIIVFFTGAFNLVSQNSLSIQGIKENGETLNTNDVFLLDDFCTFYIQDDNGEKKELLSSKWQLLCKDNDDNDIIEREINNQSEFAFLLDDLTINTTTSRSLHRINSDSDNSVYFEAYVRCYGSLEDGKVFDLSFPIYLNLLPSIPYYEIIDYNKIEDYLITIDIFCSSERSKELDFIKVEYDGPRKYTTIIPIENNSVHRFTISPELTAEFSVVSRNKYGGLTTEYIEIPAYIYTGIDDMESGELISFYPNPFHDNINISGDINQINSLAIYDINGRLMKNLFQPQTRQIQLEELPSGVYTIDVKLNSNSGYKKYKLLKK